jgi:hypothetical protein
MPRKSEPLWTAEVLNGDRVVGNAGRFENPLDVCDYMMERGWEVVHSLPLGHSHVGWVFKHPTLGMIVRAGRQSFFQPHRRNFLPRAPKQ